MSNLHSNVDSVSRLAEEYPFMDVEEILEEGQRNEAAGIHRYSIVTAGRSIKGKDLEQNVAIVT